MLVEGLLEKAETQPMPAQLPLELKSPRFIAIQLTKRFRDVQYRTKERKDRGLKKPPSVVIAAIALDAGPMSDSLVAEVRAIAKHFAVQIRAAEAANTRFRVFNPAHPADEFIDRWPENRETQRMWLPDLEYLVKALDDLAKPTFDPEDVYALLERLFGESLAKYAIEKHFAGQNEVAKINRLGMSPTGALKPILTTPAVTTSLILPTRASTNMGCTLDDLDD